MKVAYVLSRYPAVSETFVQAELEALLAAGVELRVYPLRPGQRSARLLEEGASNPIAPCVRRLGPAASPRAWGNALRARGAGESGGEGALRRYLRRAPHAPWVQAKAVAVWPTVCSIAEDARAFGAQHVHAHFAGVPAAAATLIAERLGVGSSFTAHAFDLFQRDTASLRAVSAAARFVVTISEANRNYLRSVLDQREAQRVIVLHCGVDVGRFVPSPNVAGPLLSVARLVPKKGLDVLVEAVALLRRRGLRPGCTIVGEGPELGRLRELVRLRSLQQDVTLAGVVAPTSIPGLLARCGAFVLPCRVARDGDVDGIPVSLMEAMACGRVVVSTAVSGIGELVQSEVSGLLVPPDDPAALAEALERVLRGRVDVAALTAAARQRVEADFDVAVNARRLSQLFAADAREVLAGA